ncbi:MAG: fructose-1,6-bisphosphate aldolase/phosphatase [archaeon]
MKTTVSIIKADVGSVAGHIVCPPELLDIADCKLNEALDKVISDYYVTRCGDDLELIMCHSNGANSPKVHKLAWDTFTACTDEAKKLKLYGAGQDLLKNAFSGNVKGMGPGVAELEFEERKSDPIVCFMADKTDPAAFNLPIYKIFADPFNTAGLVIDPKAHCGFKFEVYDIYKSKKIMLSCPEEMYDLLSLIGITSRYVVKRVFSRENEPAATISTDKLSRIAGEYVGKDDPVAIVRGQSGFPAIGEVVEPFAFPHLVAGWMRGSHRGPLMPVSEEDATPSRFDGPPRIMALGFQVSNGTLIGPVDIFADKSFDNARQKALDIADYMRRHGPFQPHLLDMEDLEYTTVPAVLKKLEKRFVTLGKEESRSFRKG